MKLKQLILALSALSASMAWADTTIYGQLRGGYEYNKTFDSTIERTSIKHLNGGSEINDWDSRIGFKGSEELGNGLKAIWQVEGGFNIDGQESQDEQNGRLGSRESFLGVSLEALGSLRLGKIANYAYSDMQQIDPGFYSKQSVAGLRYFTRLDGFVDNAVRYDTPDWNGFSAALLYSPDEKREFVNNTRTNGQTVNLGISYFNKDYGVFARYHYQYWGDASKRWDDQTTSLKNWHRLEAGYAANRLVATVAYQETRSYGLNDAGNTSKAYFSQTVGNAIADQYTLKTDGDNQLKTKEAALTFGYQLLDGHLTPYLSFAKGWDVHYSGEKLDNTGYKQYVLGVNYDLSRQTSVYSSYGHVKWVNAALDKEQSLGIGVIHRF